MMVGGATARSDPLMSSVACPQTKSERLWAEMVKYPLKEKLALAVKLRSLISTVRVARRLKVGQPFERVWGDLPSELTLPVPRGLYLLLWDCRSSSLMRTCTGRRQGTCLMRPSSELSGKGPGPTGSGHWTPYRSPCHRCSPCGSVQCGIASPPMPGEGSRLRVLC